MYFWSKIFTMTYKGCQRWHNILAQVTPVTQVTPVYGTDNTYDVLEFKLE